MNDQFLALRMQVIWELNAAPKNGNGEWVTD